MGSKSILKAASGIGIVLGSALQTAQAASPTDWVTTIDPALYGSSGTITFNDWGYTGPTGVGANDFQVSSGFDSDRVGQIQTVVTLDPDWGTLDPAQSVMKDPIPPSYAGMPGATYSNASMDATVNFYAWAYTTVGGSTFNNMQIDKAGNYFIARDDMSFQFYDTFMYHDVTGVNPNEIHDTAINFQPYAISDARGWCGSVLASSPNALEVMAGQVTFDFAFDAYLLDGTPVPGSAGGTQIVPDFAMRSYGSYTVNVAVGPDVFNYVGEAVVNNNNPNVNPLDANGQLTDAALDPAYQNRVSFLGAGVIPKGVWVTPDSYNPDGTRRLNPDSTWAVTVVDMANPICDPNNPGTAPVAGAVCYQNGFAGYPFLMRADGERVVTYINPTGFSDYLSPAPVPVPAAVWLFGSGLLGLAGLARRRVS